MEWDWRTIGKFLLYWNIRKDRVSVRLIYFQMWYNDLYCRKSNVKVIIFKQKHRIILLCSKVLFSRFDGRWSMLSSIFSKSNMQQTQLCYDKIRTYRKERNNGPTAENATHIFSLYSLAAKEETRSGERRQECHICFFPTNIIRRI